MIETKHTLGSFEEALKNTRKSVLTMASMAQSNLYHAVRGLLERDEALCNDAIAEDEEVNSYERIIDRDGVDILLRFNPMATDLRMVVAAMKISTNLERISDHATSIARRARKILRKEEIADVRLIEPIYDLASELLQDSVKSFSDEDVDIALTLYPRDQVLDKMHRRAIKRFTHAMGEDSENLKTYLNLIFIVRCLERVGDHAVNIGEDSVYIQRATDIRHIGPAALEEE